MRIKLPKPLPQPRTEPDLSRRVEYIEFLREMQKIKIPRNRDRVMANDALEAARLLARVIENFNDLGGCLEQHEADIMLAVERLCKKIGSHLS